MLWKVPVICNQLTCNKFYWVICRSCCVNYHVNLFLFSQEKWFLLSRIFFFRHHTNEKTVIFKVTIQFSVNFFLSEFILFTLLTDLDVNQMGSFQSSTFIHIATYSLYRSIIGKVPKFCIACCFSSLSSIKKFWER